MIGLDKVIIKTGIVEISANRLKTNILEKFGINDDIHSNNVDKIDIKNPNFRHINWIKIIKKLGTTTTDRCRLEIEVNYPRYFEENNFNLVTKQVNKEKVDFNIRLLIAGLFDINVDKVILDYVNLEAATQFKVKRFSDYSNVIYFFHRALCNAKYSEGLNTIFSGYSDVLDRFFLTGFNYKLMKGFKLKLYDKTLENNIKNEESKIYGSELKTEFSLTTSVIKKIIGTTCVEAITLEKIRISLQTEMEVRIKKAVIEQFKKNEAVLRDRLNKMENISPKSVELFVTENNEWILDADTFNCILHKKVVETKTIKTSKRCQAAAKYKLLQLGKSNSPKRNNLKNIERLELFLKNSFGTILKIKQTREKEPEFF